MQAPYAAAQVEVGVSALLIPVNRLYRHTMTAQELYDATCIDWTVGKQREKVYAGVIREVYEVVGW